MPIQTIPWNDSSGDNIYIEYDAPSGDQILSVSSDPHTDPTKERSKTITITAQDENGPVTCTIDVHQKAAYQYVLGQSVSGDMILANGSNYLEVTCQVAKMYLGTEESAEQVAPEGFTFVPLVPNGCVMSAELVSGKIRITADNRGNDKGAEGTYKLTWSYQGQQSEVIVKQQANDAVSIGVTKSECRISLPEGVASPLPASEVVFTVETSLYQETTETLTSGGTIVTSEEVNNVPNVVVYVAWATVNGRTVTIHSRGTDPSESIRYTNIRAEYEGATAKSVSVYQMPNIVEDIAINQGTTPYVAEFHSTNGGTTHEDALPASGEVTTISAVVKADYKEIYTSGAQKTCLDQVVPEKYITYRMETADHINFNELAGILRCYNRGTEEGPEYSAEIIVMCKGFEMDGNYIYQEANVKTTTETTTYDAAMHLTYGVDSYGSQVFPFYASGFAEIDGQREFHPIVVTVTRAVYTQLVHTFTSTPKPVIENLNVQYTPVSSPEDIICEGDDFSLYQKINQEDDGLFGFMFQPRGKVIGSLRPGTIKLSGLPTSFTVYQQENEKTLVTSSIFEDFSIEARDVMEHGLNDPITQTDLDGRLVYIFHARPGGSALGFDVHFKNVALYQYTSGETDKVVNASYDFTLPLDAKGEYEYKRDENGELVLDENGFPIRELVATNVDYRTLWNIKESDFDEYEVVLPFILSGEDMYEYKTTTPPEHRSYIRINFPDHQDNDVPQGEMIIIPCYDFTDPKFDPHDILDKYNSYIKVVREENKLEGTTLRTEGAVLTINGQAEGISIPAGATLLEIAAYCPADNVYSSGFTQDTQVDAAISVVDGWAYMSNGLLVINKNLLHVPRTTTVIASYPGHEFSHSMTITQAAAPNVTVSMGSLTGNRTQNPPNVTLEGLTINLGNDTDQAFTAVGTVKIRAGSPGPTISRFTSVQVPAGGTAQLGYLYGSGDVVYDENNATITLSLEFTDNAGNVYSQNDVYLGVVADLLVEQIIL